MKRRTYLVNFLTMTVGAVALAVVSTVFCDGGRTQALTYQSGVGVDFTFNPTIAVNVSGDLTINELTPGSYSDSNIIDVGVSTNTVAGYTLAATVGTKAGASTALVHTENSNYKFTNLTANAATLSAMGENYWGYSYSTDSGTTWVSGSVGSVANGYNGLPLDNNDDATKRGAGGVTLIDSSSAADNRAVKFKIGARAGMAQPAGDYTNTINFYAVAKPAPTTTAEAFAAAGKTKYNGYYKMQDMSTAICDSIGTVDEDSQTQLIDMRDGKVYWMAKLQDGHCWMTQNLDLNLSTNQTLTSADTDLNQFGANNYDTNNGYACSNTSTSTNCTADGEVIKWTPERDTINAITTESTSIASLPTYQNDANNPYSVDPGDWYWYGKKYNSSECPSNSDNNYLGCNYISKPSDNNWSTYFSTSQFTANGNGTHGHVGNYYNWASSVASNNAGAFTTDTSSDTSANPKNSICPKGWRLPVTTAYTLASLGTNEFNNLNYYYNNKSSGTDEGLISKPLYFVRGGSVWSYALHGAGYYGVYWSSTVVSSSQAYLLDFGSGWVNPRNAGTRLDGLSVRCVAQ